MEMNAFLFVFVLGNSFRDILKIKICKRLCGWTTCGILLRLLARPLLRGVESPWNSNLLITLRMTHTVTHAHRPRKSFPGTSERIRKLLKSSNCSMQWTTPPHYPLKLIEVTYATGSGCRMNQIKLSLERSYICIN